MRKLWDELCWTGLPQGLGSVNWGRQRWGFTAQRVSSQTWSPFIWFLQLAPPMIFLRKEAEVLRDSLSGSLCWCRALNIRQSHAPSMLPQGWGAHPNPRPCFCHPHVAGNDNPEDVIILATYLLLTKSTKCFTYMILFFPQKNTAHRI